MWNVNRIYSKLTFINLFLLYLSDYGLGFNTEGNLYGNPTILSPVILIPGLGGTALQAKLNRFLLSKSHSQCYKTSEYFHLWLNPSEMIPKKIDCWVDNIKLQYNHVTRKTTNTPGVDIKLPEFGKTDGIEWIDTSPLKYFDNGAYFQHITDALTNRGYVRGRTLFGASYDFRKAPNENAIWFKKMEKLIELAYNTNNKTGVTFIAHSMGGRMILQFLQQKSQIWKNKYVKQLISLSSPWGGSMVTIQALSIGYSFGEDKFVKNDKMKKAERTFPSIVWLLPTRNAWEPNDVLASTTKNNYTVRNIEEFLRDTHNLDAIEMRKDLHQFNSFAAPGVELHCLYGNDVLTINSLHFGTSFDTHPTIIKENGDGTVNKRSLVACERWKNAPEQKNHKVYQREFSKIDHSGMLSSSATINYILSKLTGKQDYPRANEKTIKSDNVLNIRLF